MNQSPKKKKLYGEDEEGEDKSLERNCINGISDAEIVMLDFDKVFFQHANRWARRAYKHHKLNGYILFKSSKNNYHVVFDRKVSWAENMSIVAWVTLISHNQGLKDWLIMQCIKGYSTLRVSPKQDKPQPRIVYRYGSQNHQIKTYLHKRKEILESLKKIERVTE